ncbi:MAG: metal-dependent hydrolase [Gammaproteobacteria bacterium]
MDTVTQIALGAAVGEAVIGKQIGRKALLWGAVCGTIPDLDVFVPLGNAVMDFTYHRGASHSLFVLALLTPLMVWLVNRIHPQYRDMTWRWAAMIYTVFVTHVLLDSFTTYGTQIFWPIDNTPVALSTIFIIDPLYTVPLLVGIIAVLMSRNAPRGRAWNHAGLLLSTLYLGWTAGAKLHVDAQVNDALAQQDIAHDRVFTTPAPFNSLLWRTVVMDEGGYFEGYYSLLDDDNAIRFHRYASEEQLLAGLEDDWNTQRLKWFSKGFYSVRRERDEVVISDLRMGYEPDYVFRYAVAEISNPHSRPVEPRHLPPERDWNLLNRIWQRIWDQDVILAQG